MFRQDNPVYDGECGRYPPSLDTVSQLENYNSSLHRVRDHTWCYEFVETGRVCEKVICGLGNCRYPVPSLSETTGADFGPSFGRSLDCFRPPSLRWTIRLVGRLQLSCRLAMPYTQELEIMAPKYTRVTSVPSAKFTNPPRSTKMK